MNTKILGKKIITYKTIDSTQKEIWRKIKENKIENGTIIKAEIQTAGIGTHGKKWYTEKTGNIAISIYIETDCKVEQIKGITVEIAKIITKVMKEIYNIKLEIKYPNDVVKNGRKIAGILTETKIQKEQVKKIVIGIGINANQTEFAEEIENIATSIKKEYGIDVENKKIIERICEEFEKWLIEKNIIEGEKSI